MNKETKQILENQKCIMTAMREHSSDDIELFFTHCLDKTQELLYLKEAKE